MGVATMMIQTPNVNDVIRSLIVVCLITGLHGCATNRNDAGSSEFRSASTATATDTNIYAVQQKGNPTIGLALTVGPFQTSGLSSYAGLGSASKEPVRKVQQVSFRNDKLMRVYDVSSQIGPGAHVQVGFERTGEMQKIGFWSTEKAGPLTGVLTREGQFVGSFTQLPPLTTRLGFPRAPEPGESNAFTRLQTSAGTIFGQPEGKVVERSSKLDEVLYGIVELVDNYVLDGKTVATFDGRTVHFDDALPHDARLCIVAQMSLRALDRRVQEDARNGASLSVSSARLSQMAL